MTDQQSKSLDERLYKSMYKWMVKKFGHDGTTMTSELNKIGYSLFGRRFLGAFAQDQLPDEIYDGTSKFALVNTDTSDGRGEHWVGVAGIPGSKKVMIFDSFGRATKTLLPLLRGGTIDTEYDHEQKKIQDSCGQFSMAWLKFFEGYGARRAKNI